ncbi:MAG: hypothetical protein NTX22_08245 [Ignavibacteriales bacterium]|nr:hypothetical protein [Ignavibacteriales bacterium]
MNKKSENKIIYSINFADVQQVAEENFGRKLTKDELKIIEAKIGDYFSWYDSIHSLIYEQLGLESVDDE